MPRIDGAPPAGPSSNPHEPEPELKSRIRALLARQSPIERQMTLAHLSGDAGTRCEYFQAAAELARREGATDQVSWCARMALKQGLDLRRCGPDLAPFAPSVPRDSIASRGCSRAASGLAAGAAAARCAAGAGRAGAPADTVARDRLEHLARARAAGRSVAQAFYGAEGESGRVSSLHALGQSSMNEVRSRFGTADAATLERTSFTAMCNEVAARIQARVRTAMAEANRLRGDAAARGAFWARHEGEDERLGALRGLGVPAADAREIARTAGTDDARFRRALERARSGLDELHRQGTRGALREEVALGLFASCRPVVVEVKRELQIRPGSFLAQAIDSGLRRGEAILRRDSRVNQICGIAASIALGAVTGGAAWAALGAKSVGAAATELAGLAAAKVHADQTDTAEGIGVTRRGEAMAARRVLERQVAKSGAKIIVSGAAGYGGKALGLHAGEKVAGKLSEESAVWLADPLESASELAGSVVASQVAKHVAGAAAEVAARASER